MKITILKDNIKSGLDGVGRVVNPQLNLPVLSNILIKAEGSGVKFFATDLELAITKSVFGKVVEEGTITIPHQTLSSIVNNTQSERINLESSAKNTLKIQTDTYEATLQGTSEEEFPIIPKIEKKEAHLEIEAATLKKFLERVVLAGDVSDLRPEISGVLFKIDGKSLTMTATDSFRLAEGTVTGGQIKNKFKDKIAITVPLKTIREIVRTTEDNTAVRFFIDKNQALFETDGVSLISRLVEGDFPDYKEIIPKETETRVYTNKESLIGALKLASAFVGRTNDIIMRTKNKKVLEIHSRDSSIGENRHVLPAKIDGPETEAIFNWKYLLDGVRAVETKEVLLGLNGNERPAVIKSTGDDSYFYILMPIRPV
jgi:DNA polymerase-3 subunit beta